MMLSLWLLSISAADPPVTMRATISPRFLPAPAEQTLAATPPDEPEPLAHPL